ncbi:unnamed protein product [Brachionus calyciflorus]|uniref:Potassium channel domain-containing protein n=1 Tax=Brachionus calyciflorus TaxID=104777 RepID=A0A814FT98_9BILA|nr:unnamed protein product [Brachionus calyciflorus]
MSEIEEIEQKPANKKNKQFLKQFGKFVVFHFGLLLLVGVYAVAGAFLFRLLEEHNEAKNCQEGKGLELANIVNLKSDLLTYIQFNISSVSSDTNKDNETVANEKIEAWLTDYRNKVLEIRSNFSYIGQDCNTSSKWNFAGALLFVMTIFTTIGYGHIAPSTWEGQIVCICYATIGIPLFLMFLSNISGVLGDMFRFLYSKLCCYFCNRRKKNLKKKTENSEGDNGQKSPEPVGLEPGSQWSDKDENKNEVKVIDDDEGEEKGDDDEEEKVTVPLTITMIVFTLYIVIGGALFSSFEGWNAIAAGYFCFITLATIGFGDFVPGQTENDPDATVKLIAGCFYLLIGMAILAMCFDLMQEEIIAKFTWLGRKLGIVDKDEDEEEEGEKKNEKEETNKEENEDKKNKDSPHYVGDKLNLSDSPAPSYTGFAGQDEKEYMSRMRSAYLQSVVQRQKKY